MIAGEPCYIEKQVADHTQKVIVIPFKMEKSFQNDTAGSYIGKNISSAA